MESKVHDQEAQNIKPCSGTAHVGAEVQVPARWGDRSIKNPGEDASPSVHCFACEAFRMVVFSSWDHVLKLLIVACKLECRKTRVLITPLKSLSVESMG